MHPRNQGASASLRTQASAAQTVPGCDDHQASRAGCREVDNQDRPQTDHRPGPGSGDMEIPLRAHERVATTNGHIGWKPAPESGDVGRNRAIPQRTI